MVTEPGTSLEWNLAMGAGMPQSLDVVVGTQHFATHLDRALVSVVSLEVLPCVTLSTQLIGWLAPLGIAHAHGGATPTRIAIPHVVDLLADAGTNWASAISRPPPGEYCSVRLTIGPADRDAIGQAPAGLLIDRALEIQGTYLRSGSTERVPFSITSTRTESIDISLVGANGAASPLVVNAEQRNVAVDVWLDPVDLLQGAEPAASVESQDGIVVIDNVLAAARAGACVAAPCIDR